MAVQLQRASLYDILETVLSASQRASEIARFVRLQGDLFVEVKEEGEGNPKFKEDFKTLADVLIQESIKFDLSKKFSVLGKSIFGEESGCCQSHDGHVIHLTISEEEHNTRSLLLRIVGSQHATLVSQLLSLIYKPLPKQSVPDQERLSGISVDLSDIALWVDPIDGTNEYVKGGVAELLSGISPSGLGCVTCLIGAFSKSSSLPFLGVVNQPFWEEESESWMGRCAWGVSYGTVKIASSDTGFSVTAEDDCASCVVVVSSSEEPQIVQQLQRSHDFHVIQANGAGYKLLCVIDGLVAAYLTSKPTIYQWDTCGPHAILLALGGGVISYHDNKDLKSLDNLPQLSYHVGGCHGDPCHSNGIIAYRSISALSTLLSALQRTSQT